MLTNPLPPFLQRALPPTLGALALFCATLSSEPAHAFGKKPVVVAPTPPPPPPVVPPSSPEDVIRARWENNHVRDGAAWSQHVFDTLPALAPRLLANAPADIANFCPRYASLGAADKKNFWVYLVSSIAQLESGFNPNASYTENFKDAQGNLVVSLGLLQLSVGDAPCSLGTRADAVNPEKNLDCGLQILDKWVGRDRVLSSKSGASWLGGARYWSTLRSARLAEIQAWTRALPMCGG